MFATRKTLYGMVTAATLSLMLVGPAMAQSETTATVTGGDLDITIPVAGDFEEAFITGADQTTEASLGTFNVSDLTGTGDGWAIQAQATQFDGASHDLPLGSLSMSQPGVTSLGTDSPDPDIEVGPYVIDAVTAVPLAAAGANEGMGVYTFGATDLTLALDAAVFEDAYDSTVTISLVSAP
jgi:hypothetical protein